MINQALRGYAYDITVPDTAQAQALFFQGGMPSQAQLESLLFVNGVATNFQTLITWVGNNGGKYIANTSIPAAGALFIKNKSLYYAYDKTALSIVATGDLNWFILVMKSAGVAVNANGAGTFCLAGTVTEFNSDGDLLTGLITVDLSSQIRLSSLPVSLAGV